MVDQTHAQSALPNDQSGTPGGKFVVLASSDLADICHKERRGRLVKAASERRAPRDEACQLIGSFSEAELRMIRYVVANSAKCGLQHVAARLKTGHAKTEEMYRRICAVPGV